MAAKGLVTPMPQCAIFADTQAEPPSVYRWLDWLEKQLPFPVHRVTAGSLTEASLRVGKREDGSLWMKGHVPVFSTKPDGSVGPLWRICTADFKLAPIFKKAKELGAIKRGQKTVGVVQWIGISLDEVSRMKDSREPWSESRWPLIEMRMNRHDCFRWMKDNGYPTPPPLRLLLLPISFRCRVAQVENGRTGGVSRCGQLRAKASGGIKRSWLFHWRPHASSERRDNRQGGLLHRRGTRPNRYVPKRV